MKDIIKHAWKDLGSKGPEQTVLWNSVCGRRPSSGLLRAANDGSNHGSFDTHCITALL